MKVVNIIQKNRATLNWKEIRAALLQAMIENYEWGITTSKVKDGHLIINFNFFKTTKGFKEVNKQMNGYPFHVYKAISEPVICIPTDYPPKWVKSKIENHQKWVMDTIEANIVINVPEPSNR